MSADRARAPRGGWSWVVLPVVVMACGGGRPYPAMVPVVYGPQATGVCEGMHNSFECATAVETNRIDAARGTVTASEDSVCFRGDGWNGCTGRTFGHADFPGQARYLGTLPAPWLHVFWVQYFEGSDVRVMGAGHGRQWQIADNPVASPDGRRLVVAAADLVAQYGPNQLAIWHWEADSLYREWSVSPEDWEPRSASWTDNEELRVVRGWPFRDGYPSDTVRVVFDGRTWVVRGR